MRSRKKERFINNLEVLHCLCCKIRSDIDRLLSIYTEQLLSFYKVLTEMDLEIEDVFSSLGINNDQEHVAVPKASQARPEQSQRQNGGSFSLFRLSSSPSQPIMKMINAFTDSLSPN